jgi:hypothetical protein
VNGANIEVAVRNNRGGQANVTIHDDILLYVNVPDGGEPHPLSYASIMGRHRRSFGEVHARGFDANAEPVIRQMPDRSFRLVFCTMPPRAHVLGEAFDMNDFAKRLIKLTDAKITWDDRDVYPRHPSVLAVLRQGLRTAFARAAASNARCFEVAEVPGANFS